MNLFFCKDTYIFVLSEPDPIELGLGSSISLQVAWLRFSTWLYNRVVLVTLSFCGFGTMSPAALISFIHLCSWIPINRSYTTLLSLHELWFAFEQWLPDLYQVDYRIRMIIKSLKTMACSVKNENIYAEIAIWVPLYVSCSNVSPSFLWISRAWFTMQLVCAFVQFEFVSCVEWNKL